jgi:hypothetical protein
MLSLNFKNKYLKYKLKYNELKKQLGGFNNLPFDDNYCSICLSNININDPVLLTSCDHLFHRDCLNRWL